MRILVLGLIQSYPGKLLARSASDEGRDLCKNLALEDSIFPRARVRTLRQVVAERRQEHILRGGGLATSAGPRIPLDKRILRPKLNLAFRTAVEAVPEPDRGLGDQAAISGTAGLCAGGEPAAARQGFGGASAVGK